MKLKVNYEAMVQELWDRDAVRDCVARYCRGMDRFDRELVLSAFHPDALEEHGKFVGNPVEFVDWAIDQHAQSHLSHQHYMLNHRSEIEGDTAHAETYFLFVSMNKQGKPWTMGGGRYLDRLERRDGHWAIAARVTVRDTGLIDDRPEMHDLTAFTSTRSTLSDDVRAFMQAGLGPKRDQTDPSYMRPLTVDPARAEAFRRIDQKVRKA